MSLENAKHYPVMLNQILSIISPQHGGMFIDCTFGGGGYTKAILKFSDTNVIAVDRDKIANQHASTIFNEFPNRFKFFHDKFSNLSKIVKSSDNLRAIIFDLGLSSFQIADSERGFSFKKSGPLNMEMGINERSVFDTINKLDQTFLEKVIKVLGEEKDAKKIASEIVKRRLVKPIENSDELVSIIKSVKKNYKKFKKDPATKTFMALRIFVNKELTELIGGLFAATKMLRNGGILAVVNFHSLEDKIVKSFFNLYFGSEKNPSRYIPKKNNYQNFDLFSSISKKPLRPEKQEIEKNIRSRSAKLRYGIRNEKPFFNSEAISQKFINYLKIEELTI